ncbi:hypothetical protein HPP92_000568 [Vanilla planifolia]|uniref:Uncharacterized protein n=1 Tax=Vanilla planifolia TaxID=51239 RepID=A0A835VEI6_VANPL|nr:hypothetical protein HPP92_000568 [Vanilla planifolia]
MTEQEQDHYVNKLVRLRDNWGRFIGEIMRFRKVAAGLLTPAPKTGRADLPALESIGTGAIFAGEPPERSNAAAVEFFGLVEAQISSLCPGVSGVKTERSATDESTGISRS